MLWWCFGSANFPWVSGRPCRFRAGRMAGWVVLASQMVSHPPRELRRDNLRVSRGVQDRRYRVRRGVVCGAVDRRVRVGCRRNISDGAVGCAFCAPFKRVGAGDGAQDAHPTGAAIWRRRVRGFHAPPRAGRANGACEHAPYACC